MTIAPFDLGRPLTGDFAAAEAREWLVTNGLGGFAAGTVAGLPTRRYHGLLFASLKPPVARSLLLAALHETATYDGQRQPLHVVRWRDGFCDEAGARRLERFHLEGTIPVFTFALGDAQLTKRVFMEPGRNATFVVYRLERGSGPLTLELTALVNARDVHALGRTGGVALHVAPLPDGIRVVPGDGTPSFTVRAPGAVVEPRHDWYAGFELAEEKRRGFDHVEDHLAAARLTATLAVGESLVVRAAVEGDEPEIVGALERRRAYEADLLDRAALPDDEPAWVRQLVLAADQFVVRRDVDGTAGQSVIAGYPWFCDWGRDTMIALPGLALATGRPELAGGILRTFARFVDRGMLPNRLARPEDEARSLAGASGPRSNRFPDGGEPPEYNTVDAALWYVEAVRQTIEATDDPTLLAELFPFLESIVEHHRAGTRYGIGVDPADGLLRAGEPGVQLTWMDAKLGDWVVTPRIGKPVEVNALWYQALVTLGRLAARLGRSPDAYESDAARVRTSFARFWNPATGGLFDVLDGPDGDDAAIRPNQIFAVSLPDSPLSPERQRSVVDLSARHLLTSHGLRSLSPSDPSYRGRYVGDGRARDGAYHQGTVWGWLLGPFALAHHRVHGDAPAARALLEPMARQMEGLAIGTLAEIFDGDPPHAPRGAVAQAWTVSETLRAWRALSQL